MRQLAQTAAVAVQRALILAVTGRAREGIVLASAALQKADGGQMPPGPTVNVRRDALRARIVGETRAGDVAAAEKTSATLDQVAAQRSDDPVAQSAMHFGRGMLAVAKADLRRRGVTSTSVSATMSSAGIRACSPQKRPAMRRAHSARARRSSRSTFAIPFI